MNPVPIPTNGDIDQFRLKYFSTQAVVAQLDRAPVYGTGGREFESLRPHTVDIRIN